MQNVHLAYQLRKCVAKMSQQGFSFELSEFEETMLRRFRTLTQVDLLDEFSSDDFRMYGLDRHFADPSHDIGILFAKAVHHKKMLIVGRKRSVLPKNNMREIKVYVWNDNLKE